MKPEENWRSATGKKVSPEKFGDGGWWRWCWCCWRDDGSVREG